MTQVRQRNFFSLQISVSLTLLTLYTSFLQLFKNKSPQALGEMQENLVNLIKTTIYMHKNIKLPAHTSMNQHLELNAFH